MNAGTDRKEPARKGGPSIDMTQGPAVGSMLRFALPMILGNLLQQCYNIADTLIVGRFLGANALAAVGSSFTLIGCLFLLYGLYRGLGRPGMSVVLTVASLGTRVALAYLLPAMGTGVVGVWWSVPIGWALADVIGFAYYLARRRALISPKNLPR